MRLSQLKTETWYATKDGSLIRVVSPISNNWTTVLVLDDNGQPCAERVMHGLTVVIYNMAAGSVGAYLPEANVLLSLDAVDTQSLTPAYKSVPVTLKKA